MSIIYGIDASTKCTGLAKFDSNKKLIEYVKIKPKTTWSTLEKIIFVSQEVAKKIEEDIDIDKIIIEDIYLGHFRGANQVKGFATLARLSGAVISAIIQVTKNDVEDIIILRNAVSARPLVGLKGTCQKAEVQVWVLRNFTEHDTSEYDALIEAVQAKKQVKDIAHKEYKKRMLEISKMIEKETDFGEDISDAILLAYGELNKGE